MRKFLTALLLAVSASVFAACKSGEIGTSGKQPEGSVTIEMSELPETATAELGERFDIPEVTARAEYYDLKYLWFQVKSESGSIWVDNLIGIFDNYTEDKNAPAIDLGTQAPHDKISFQTGRKLVVPVAVVYDNSMEEISASFTVTDKAGTDITGQT